MYDGPIISGEPCKTHAAHLMYNDVGRLVCIGCLVWRDEKEWPEKVAKLELQNDVLRENLAKMAEEMKVTTGYPRQNEGWNAACDEIASRIRFTKPYTEKQKDKDGHFCVRSQFVPCPVCGTKD